MNCAAPNCGPIVFETIEVPNLAIFCLLPVLGFNQVASPFLTIDIHALENRKEPTRYPNPISTIDVHNVCQLAPSRSQFISKNMLF
jgi:hypothetical protein